VTTESLLTPPIKPTQSRRRRTYTEFRSGVDQRVLRLFANKSLRRMLRAHTKLNFPLLWALTAKALDAHHLDRPHLDEPRGQWDVHRSIVAGLPGEALFISSAMAFDSMQEALPFFEVSAKTARLRLESLLPANEGEIALRIGRVLIMAGDAFGSFEAARHYLRTPNFALGGDIARDLLKTAEGEQLVLAELQTQAAGGPV
jgi:uncharacterized protein (DUF2384 family)